MQKYLTTVFILIHSADVYAQRSIDSMVTAEKKFANTSLVVSTQDAFIKFIDPSGIVFDKGKPTNGLDLYTKAERRPGILTWEPEFAEVASTNDFGYTTGPWKYYANAVTDKPERYGYFVTVWHLTHNEWKFMIDFGITCPKENKKVSLKKSHGGNLKSNKENEQTCIEAEQRFIDAFSAEGVAAYKSFLSLESRINYAGFAPATTAQQRKPLLDSLPRSIKYTIIGSAMSPARDLGYVYGSTVINDKQDGYLRIWRKEKNGWRIAVEVLHFR